MESSPYAPNPIPGDTATFAFSNRSLENSNDFRTVQKFVVGTYTDKIVTF